MIEPNAMGLWDHIKQTSKVPAPTAIEESQGSLRVTWEDAVETEATFRELRLGCPCAVCVEEWTGRRLIDAAAVAPDVKPQAIASVGNYAISITWSDGHSTGIYAWPTLRALGRVV